MYNFRVVCFLAVVFCLFFCVYANADVSKEDEATAAVAGAREAVTTVRAKAEKELNDAKGLLQRVESSKEDVAKALAHSQEVATGNEVAVLIAQGIKSLSDGVGISYLEAKQKMETAVSTLTLLLTEANDLYGKRDIPIMAKDGVPDDYTETNENAAALQRQAGKLDGRITEAVNLFSGVDTTAEDMEKKTKEAQLKNSHVSVIVAVAKIGTMLKNADTTIGQIEGKKNEVSGIVGEMQTLKTNHPTVSGANIEALHESANNALIAATGALDNANRAKADIQTQKGLADAVLTKVQPETGEVREAQKEVQKAEECVTAAERIVPQLNNEQQTATNSVISANDAKDNLKRALSTATSATRPDQSVTNPKVKELQDSVSASVSTIQSMMGKADGTLQETKNNKEAVHDIVEEMKTLSTTEFIEANENIKVLYNKADDALTAATGAVKNAEKAKTDMTAEKEKADSALSSVETATDVNTAQKEVNTVNECVNQANQFAAILNNALQTAKDSVKNANDAKQKLQTALLTTTSKPDTEQSSTHSQVKPLQDSVSADVKAIQTIVGEADRILQEAKKHKQEVYDIVQEMKKLKTTAKIESNDINELCKNAESELTKATGAVEKVKTEKEAIRQEKVIADAALKDVNAATEINKAQQQANTATSCLDKVKENLSQLRIALQTAKSTVENANDLKQKLKTALSTTTTAPSTEQNTQRNKSDIPEGDGTGTDQKDTTTQPTLTNTEQPASKELLDQGDNSAYKFKHTLIKAAKNVPTTALTGEKAPAPGAKNDSAMIVSMPLLVALIASAVLQ